MDNLTEDAIFGEDTSSTEKAEALPADSNNSDTDAQEFPPVPENDISEQEQDNGGEEFVDLARLPRILGSDIPDAFRIAYDRALACYQELPLLDEAELYAELSDLTIHSKPTKSVELINQELQRVQAASERLSEIVVNVTRCYTIKKRMVDILSAAWTKFSKEKAKEQREGDAHLRLIEFETDLVKTEALKQATDHIVKNLQSLQSNLSRRITVFQLQLNLQNLGRGALPEYDFNETAPYGSEPTFEPLEDNDGQPGSPQIVL